MRSAHRNRPIADVITEIEKLKTRHVMFIDDNFIGDPAWTREFVRAITPLGLTWNAAVSSNIGRHLDLVDEMKASGCRSLFIGFETINADSIASVGKYQNRVEAYEATIKEIHDREIMINASVVFGFDHDGPKVFEDTLNWLVKKKIETMTAHILTPYPGTALFDELETAGRIVDRNPDHYNTAHVVFKSKGLTPEELFEGYLWIYKELIRSRTSSNGFLVPGISGCHIFFLLSSIANSER